MEMTNTDLEMFMENLRKLVYENYYTTSIGNNPLIEAKKPEIRLLYEELCNLIAIHEPEDVGNWKTRLIQAALEAEDSVDMFVSSAIIKNDFELDGDDKAHPIHEAEDVGYWQTVCSSVDFAEDSLSDVDDEALQIHEQEDVGNWKTSLIEELHESEDVGSWKTRFIEALQADDSVDMFESSAEYSLPDGDDEVHPRTLILINNTLDFSLKKLKVVMDDLKSMKEEMKGNLFQNLVKQDMMMDNKLEDTRICSNSNTTANPSAKEHEQLIVGFEDDVRLIMDRLTGYHKKLDIISIVGMGGLENFFKKMSMPLSDNNPFSDSTSSIVKQRRLFIDYEVLCMIHSHDFATRTRSVMCFQTNHLKYKTTRWVLSFLLLRVLDLLTTPIFSISEISMLVHLRYLAVWLGYRRFSFSEPRKKANLGSLQTLIVKGEFKSFSYSPGNTENLRHLRCDRINFPSDFGGYKLFHLQTVSRLSLRSADMAGILNKFFPNIKKLGCIISSTSSKQESLSFVLLSHLEALTIEKYTSDSLTLVKPIRFPEALKKLTLKGLSLPWSYMSTIQRLPKLEVLKLLDSSFTGQMWETGDEQFQQLKYLKLEKLNIRFWEASSISFPHLRKLVVRRCEYLKEIPLDLGNIYTLEHIETDYSNSRVLESVKIIQEAQDEMGNYDFHVNFIHMDPSEVFFEGNPFFD
ncbi:hypothetical protein L1987_50644 [Smallanthus sonchifolius]|uniref:Uncharacterized protein n=1 Tax=Smallanthus sonchifolius TaxID=185202 RepID=A0ACB9ENJ5_9ASTR|nr:hypothetical protein L1987_50644 [Smallanthus sonchifolius]